MFELSGTDSPPGASVYREQVISRVGYSRRALCWLYAVTADVNNRMISAATALNLAGCTTVAWSGHRSRMTGGKSGGSMSSIDSSSAPLMVPWASC
jgi:hypothetical protein